MDLGIRYQNTFEEMYEQGWQSQAEGADGSALKPSSSHRCDGSQRSSTASSLADSDAEDLYTGEHAEGIATSMYTEDLYHGEHFEEVPTSMYAEDDAESEGPGHFASWLMQEDSLPPYPNWNAGDAESRGLMMPSTHGVRSSAFDENDVDEAYAALGTTTMRHEAWMQPDYSLGSYSHQPSCEGVVDYLLHHSISSTAVSMSHAPAVEDTSFVNPSFRAPPPPPPHPLQPGRADVSLQRRSNHSSMQAEADASKNAGVRTTLMLRNIPRNTTRSVLLKKIDSAGFKGKYDFFYLPMDFNNSSCLGFAFINLIDPAHVMSFWLYFEGYSVWLTSKNTCTVGWSSKHQGLEANIERYRNSPVMHESVPDGFKPLLFRDGVRIPFPPPTRAMKLAAAPETRPSRTVPLTPAEKKAKKKAKKKEKERVKREANRTADSIVVSTTSGALNAVMDGPRQLPPPR
eukprot:TRINITY_DN7720_c1_g1_i1.p1 TRINITY_DN7720_c1_g1~~TRINITY_DN7720_c1_g1_i1.p1  ORF type:complete len:458 (+),score=63.61 TRINITY_DN7720_c1_g1_i1:93-1466(+)